jgi:hypothetical protein
MTDFRALCAELDALLNDIASTHPNLSKNGVNVINDLSDRARTALAQPKPVAPTDEELEELFYANDNLSKHCEAGTDWSEPLMMRYEFPAVARAVLARWGQP